MHCIILWIVRFIYFVNIKDYFSFCELVMFSIRKKNKFKETEKNKEKVIIH